MTSFYSENRASCSEIVLAHDVGSGAEVGGDTNTFQDRSGSHEHVDISDTEGVRAFRDWSGASSYKAVSLKFKKRFKSKCTRQGRC